MSINTMTSNAVRRILPPKSISDSKGGADSTAIAAAEATQPLGETNILPDNAVATALNALIVYIPTEIVTLYVATLAAIHGFTSETPISPELLYGGFVLFTPIFTLLVFLSKASSTYKDVPLPSPSQWPWWSMVASSIAFLVWALAIPEAPYVGEVGSTLAGIGAVFVSMILSVVEPIALRFVKA